MAKEFWELESHEYTRWLDLADKYISMGMFDSKETEELAEELYKASLKRKEPDAM